MKGIPHVFSSKQDWLNAHQYAMAKGEVPQSALKERLRALRDTGTTLVVRDGAPENPEDQTPDDFESIEDLASPLARSGLTVAEIDLMISQLG